MSVTNNISESKRSRAPAEQPTVTITLLALPSVQWASPSVLTPSIREGKNLPCWQKKNLFTGRKKDDGRNLRKSHRGGCSARTNRHAVDVKKRTTKSQFTSYIDRVSDTNYDICNVCGSRRRLSRMRHFPLWWFKCIMWPELEERPLKSSSIQQKDLVILCLYEINAVFPTGF